MQAKDFQPGDKILNLDYTWIARPYHTVSFLIKTLTGALYIHMNGGYTEIISDSDTTDYVVYRSHQVL